MNKIIVATLAYLCLIVTAAWGQDATELYNRGLRSSLAFRKIEYFTKALQLNPNLVEAYEKRAIHYYLQRRFEKAIQDYTRVIELKPHRVSAYQMRGLTYLKKGQGEGLMAKIDPLTSSLNNSPGPEARELLERAIDDFSRAIELDPQMASAYCYRAKAFHLKGLTDEAIRDSTRAIELGGSQQTTGRAYTIRAKVYRQLGFSELANEDSNKALELDPAYYAYNYVSVTLFLASFATDSSYISAREVGWLGLILFIVLLFVIIFKLALPTPHKGDDL